MNKLAIGTHTLQTLEEVDAFFDACLGHGQHLVTPVDRQGDKPIATARYIEAPNAAILLDTQHRHLTLDLHSPVNAALMIMPMQSHQCCMVNGRRINYGKAIWVGPNSLIELFSNEAPLTLAIIQFNADQHEDVQEPPHESLVVPIPEFTLQEIARLFPNQAPTEACIELISKVATHVLDLKRNKGKPTRPQQTTSFVVAQEAYRLLRSGHCAISDIDELAAKLNTSRRTLEYGVRQHLGTSPGRLAKALRLRRVQERLQKAGGSDRTIAAIAREYGFHHAGHFARDYQELFGELPNETVKRRQTNKEFSFYSRPEDQPSTS